MLLTDAEKRMLDGEFGEGISEAMRIQVALGEAFDAERMVEIRRAHVAFTVEEPTIWFAEKLEEGGASCRVFTTNNPTFELNDLRRIGLSRSEEDVRKIERGHVLFKKLGIILTYSCTPGLEANVPRHGEIVAFSETSATVYANSVCGARTNRESANSAIAASITGRVPLYGLLLPENRKGEILVKVETTLRDSFDYALLGHAAGKRVGFSLPVFVGMPLRASSEELTTFGAQLNTSGTVGMYHIVNVTPEAPDLETAFGGGSPQKEITITTEDLLKSQESISTQEGKVDFAIFGCPHYTINQVRDVARLLEGRKINKSVECWILTSSLARDLANRMGYLKIIRQAGGDVLADTCVDSHVWERRYRGKVGMTDSPKAAYYAGGRGIHFVVKRMPDCIRAALGGGF